VNDTDLRTFADDFSKGLFDMTIVNEVIAAAKTRAGMILLAIGLVVGLIV
jgi:hypothetical protein